MPSGSGDYHTTCPTSGDIISDTSVVDLLAKTFIARTDVKAIQHPNGAWSPHTADGRVDGAKLPWTRADLEAHLNGTKTFGHYLLNTDSQCKLFAFDIDLEKNSAPGTPHPYQGYYSDDTGGVHEFDARADWHDRNHPGRNWSKYQLKMVASKLMRHITELGIPCAAAYSGNKGLHVYALTGLISASDARDGAGIVLEMLGGWTASKGNNFFRSDDTDPITGYPNISIEVFPKQSILNTGGLGNLMRLPLGKNLKSPDDPCFFLDMTAPMGSFTKISAELALTQPSPWGN